MTSFVQDDLLNKELVPAAVHRTSSIRRVVVCIVLFFVLRLLWPHGGFYGGPRVGPRPLTRKPISSREFRLPGCTCSRLQDVYSLPDGVESRCSDHATARGEDQYVVGVSIYGLTNGTDTNSVTARERYFFSSYPAIVDQVATMYPGFILRTYVDNKSFFSPIHKNLCSTFCAMPHVDICLVDSLPDRDFFNSRKQPFGMIWRFLPTVDELVSTFLSRETDSQILEREVDAVHEWLASKYSLHVMRDNPEHDMPVLGGMWGVKVAPRHFENFGHLLFDSTSTAKGTDQVQLAAIVAPYFAGDTLAHDSYLCELNWKGQTVRPFPTQRRSKQPIFIGQPSPYPAANGSMPTCPQKCRKIVSWKYC